MNSAAFHRLPFVGRAQELTALRSAVSPGYRAIVLGAAGTGKSRLVDELRVAVPDATFVVGTCSNAFGSTPYGVFREVAVHASQLLDPAELDWPSHQFADLGVLFPQLDQGTADSTLADARRHGLWLAWLRYLAVLSERVPGTLTLVFEDLHAADAASVTLFQWLAAQRSDVAIIGTSRPPLTDGLSRYPTVPLGPLADEAVHDLQSAVGLDAVSTSSIMAVTGGLPLRLREWVTSAALDGADRAQATALADIVGRLTSEQVTVLCAAALVDERITPVELAVITGESEDAVRAILERAASVGVVEADGSGYRFGHESYREALSEQLADDERQDLHRRIFAVLQARDSRDGAMLSRLAHHAIGSGEDLDTAASLHLAAGRHAAANLAPESAVRDLSMAVELAEMVGDDLLLLDARLELGLALTAIGDASAPGVLAQVYPLADQLEHSEAYVRAALAEPISFGQIGLPMQTDTRVVTRLLAAQARADTPAWRGHLLAMLALQQHASLDAGAYDTLVDEAAQLAETVDDPVLDAMVFAARYGVRRPVGALAAARAEVARSIDALAPLDPMAPFVIDLGVVSAFRAGDLPHADALIRRLETEFQPLPLVAHWSVLRAKAALAHATGSLASMERLANEAMQMAGETRLADAAFTYFGFQVAGLLRERRDVATAKEAANAWVDAHPTYAAFRSGRAWMSVDMNDIASAVSDLEVFFAQDLHELRTKVEGVQAIGMAVCAAVVCEREDWCQQGWDLLEAVRDEWFVVGEGTMIDGPVTRVMALASSVVGEIDRALDEIADAERQARTAGANLYVWHAIRDRGLILRRARRYADAIEVLSDARDRYRANELTEQADWLDGQVIELKTMVDDGAGAAVSTAQVPEGPGPTSSSTGSLRRDGAVWHIELDDESVAIRHVKGLTMLAELLARPGEHLSSAQLASVADGLPTPSASAPSADDELVAGGASVQEALDDRAVAAYQARLEEITQQMDRADRREDVEASTRLSAEFDAITEHLAKARGLGGRRRALSDDGEKARVRVTKSIRSAIRRIAESAPATADHLDRAVRTGSYCSYEPDPRRPVAWSVVPDA